jgi:hypothetical protein
MRGHGFPSCRSSFSARVAQSIVPALFIGLEAASGVSIDTSFCTKRHSNGHVVFAGSMGAIQIAEFSLSTLAELVYDHTHLTNEDLNDVDIARLPAPHV